MASGGVGGRFQGRNGERILGRCAVVLLEAEFAEAVFARGIGVREERGAFHTVEFDQIAFEVRTHDEILDAGGRKIGERAAKLGFVGDETHIAGRFRRAVAAFDPKGETEAAGDERRVGHVVEKGRAEAGFVEPLVDFGATVAQQGGGAVPNCGAGGFGFGESGLRGAASCHGEHQVGAGKVGGQTVFVDRREGFALQCERKSDGFENRFVARLTVGGVLRVARDEIDHSGAGRISSRGERLRLWECRRRGRHQGSWRRDGLSTSSRRR